MFHVKQTRRLASDLQPAPAMASTDPLSIHALRAALADLDGRGYREYRSVKGSYAAHDLALLIDHVQGDPFARPSRIRVRVRESVLKLPDWTRGSGIRVRAAADFLHRTLYEILAGERRSIGSGRGGELDILQPGQQVLERTALLLDAGGNAEIRMGVGLPADGRRILGPEAARLLCDTVPDAIRQAIRRVGEETERLRRHVEVVEDAQALRAQLPGRGLVAFVADGSLLPRASGIDDTSLGPDSAVPLRAPESLAATLAAPHCGAVRGLGIPAGVTLIVGGGYHGKSTLLRALERGVYDHVPDDGRERVVTLPDAVKIRSEDGRSVAGTDISNFIGALPGGGRPERFVSLNASGSTSQAASIVEALEVGATCLLLDEDTSAANFMIRDARMQRLIASGEEPITALVDRAKEMHARLGVSTVIVAGGSGDYFDVADTVIALTDYQPRDVTAAAKRVARELPTFRVSEGRPWRAPTPRSIVADSIDPHDGRGRVEVRLHSGKRVLMGSQEIDLSAVEQIVEPAQMRAMAWALIRSRATSMHPDAELAAVLRVVMAEIEQAGLGVVHPEPIGDLAAFRIHELAAFLARIRALRVSDLAGTRVAPPVDAADD